MISIPATIILTVIIARRGAAVGVGALWGVVAILALSLAFFFAGKGILPPGTNTADLQPVPNSDSLFHVFAIVFPAFTGMTAGVGLSGDLRNPHRSIPLGTVLGTLTGLVVYIAVVIKLHYSATPSDLASDQFIMSRISAWGPMIFIGLGAATLSSALGSILVAPRTLQALCSDRIFPSQSFNEVMSRGHGPTNDPANATWVTSLIVLVFTSMGNVNFVAQIISMFFLITYGTLCSISFLEHFAGNPSYRPTFKTKWYASLLGAVACFIMMFLMQPVYAILSLIVMTGIYLWLGRAKKGERDLAMVFRGVLFQLTRKLQITIQKKQTLPDMSNWRPSFITVSRFSDTRLASFDLLRWLCHHYGFGSYIHYIEGELTPITQKKSQQIVDHLINQTQVSGAGIFVDTVVAPSFKAAVAQAVQSPGVSGMDNNSILFSFHHSHKDELPPIIDGCYYAAVAGLNICVLRSGELHFGYRKSIHIWLTEGDNRNANLMILLAYILLGHHEWDRCEILVFEVIVSEDDPNANRLKNLLTTSRLPISDSSIRRVLLENNASFEQLVTKESEYADLIMLGLSLTKMKKDRGRYLLSFRGSQDILFVRAGENILIGENSESPDGDDFISSFDEDISDTTSEPVIQEHTTD
jgi:hypothetical protein